MRNHLTDKASEAGRFQQRLREILERTERGDLPRMDAGDMVGRQVVASLESQVESSPAAAAVLFEAQCERTRLYLESSGATPLDSAEALVDAAATLDHFGAGEAERTRLIKPAVRCLDDLLEIGSRSTAWSVAQVLVKSLMHSSEGAEHRESAIARFAELLAASLEDERHFDAFDFALRAEDWARQHRLKAASAIDTSLPALLAKELDELDTECALEGWRKLSARHEIPEIFARVVRRLAEDEQRGLAARQIYKRFLEECPGELEEVFRELAYVHPDPNLDYDADLDALNGALAEGLGEDCDWPWRNRGLLARRNGDVAGALSFLARVMMISGQPPELMGLLAPVVHRLGFEETARQFARFAPTAERRRFRLRVLDQIDAEAGSERGLGKLMEHLERHLDDVELPREFLPAIKRRLAELHLRRGAWDLAEKGFRELHAEEPTVELHALRMAEAALGGGRLTEARKLLTASFGPRVEPHVRNLEARFAESAGDYKAALKATQEALAALEDAQRAGREDTQRSWLQVQARVRKDAGAEVADGALVAMLQNDVHASRHRDLDDLAPQLRRQLVKFALKTGDFTLARETIAEARDASTPAQTQELFAEGLRIALEGESWDDANWFLEQLEAEPGSASTCVARAFLAARSGDLDTAQLALEARLEDGDESDESARLALAALHAEAGREVEALEVLDAAPDGTPELPGSAALRGSLLERAGRNEEALVAYRAAASASSGDADTWDRRLGLLAVVTGAKTDNRNLITEGVEKLAAYSDGEAIEIQGRGRALLARDATRAAEVLASFGKRMSEASASGLAVLEGHARLRAGDLKGLAELAERHPLPDELGDWLGLRQNLEALAETDADDLGAIVELARELEAGARDGVDGAVAELVSRVGMPGDDEAELPEEASDPLVLAQVLALDETQLSSAVTERLASIAASGGPYAELAQALAALGDPQEGVAPASIEDWAELSACFRSNSPFAEADLLRSQALSALGAGKHRELSSLIAAGADPRGELAALNTLALAVERGDGPGLLQGLAAIVALDDDPEWEDAQVALKAHVAASREQPSPVWASTRLRTAGKRSRIYLAGVLDYWREVLSSEEGHPAARHHIALLELARAHEEEAAGREDAEPWEAAHVAWQDLVADDDFWAMLARRHDATVVETARRRLPRRILDAHLRRAEFFLEGRKTAHAMRHARLAVKSALVTDEIRPWLRDRIYRVFAPDVERILARRDHVKALELLDRVLLADPDHEQARRELIDIAADSATRAFRVLDAFTRRPDPSTVLELAAGMREYLVVVENHVLEAARAGRPQDPTLGEALAVALRGIAFLRFHREQDVAGASEAVDLALELIPEDHGLARKIRGFRSEVGMKRVAERLEGGFTGEDPLDDALAEIEGLLAEDPDKVDLLRQKVKILVAMGRDEVAEELARKVFAHAQKEKDPAAIRDAVELLDAVSTGREALRRSSRLDSLDRLVADGNWRAAEQLFRELAIGQDDDLELIARHVEILIGLRKVRVARERIAKLGGHSEIKERRRLLEARLTCLEYMAAKGGDVYAAYELYERRDFKRCQALLQMLSQADARETGVRFLNAVCQSHLEGPERAGPIVAQARQRATEDDAFWVIELLETELAT